MNRKRCPWCGKIIDKKKDTIFWGDVVNSPSVPRMLRQANCGHCRHKYGQVPLFPYILKIDVTVILLLVVAFVFQSGFLFVLAFLPVLLFAFMPYSRLDDRGKPCEKNTDLLCEIAIIEKYGKIKCDGLYFLNDCIDDFEPFVLASPIHIYNIPKNGDVISGEFLYMHEKNDAYIKKDSCELYDTEMNLVAKIKFLIASDTIL